MCRLPLDSPRVPQGGTVARRRLRPTSGKAPFFAGYKGLRGSDIVWDERTLDDWLADPRALLSGKNTTMTLRLDDPGQRADVIAFLKTLR